MAPLPVIIAGSGLGGLLLAQGLKRHNIPVELYERDPAVDSRLQGYRIRLREEGIDALRALLPPDVLAEVEATAAYNAKPGAARDAQSGEERDSVMRLMTAGLPSPATPLKTMLFDRGALRRVLMMGLEEHVRFGKAFKQYESDEGGVVVTFEDGTTATGAVLVGAEGRSSIVARQLLGEAYPHKLTGQTLYYGKAPLTAEVIQAVGEDKLAGFQLVKENYDQDRGLLAVMEVVRFLEKRPYGMEDHVSFVISGYEDEWTGTATTESPDTDRPSSAYERIVARTAQWHPSFRALFAHADPAQLAELKVVCADPKHMTPWPVNPRVTVLGDAAHAMPPWGAFGASSTFMDVEEVFPVLVKAWEGRKGDSWEVPVEEMGVWEESLRERGKTRLAMTLDRGKVQFRARPLA